VSAWQPVLATAASTAVAVLAAATMTRKWLVRVIQGVVDTSVTEVKRAQADFERRQGAHLDRQDLRLDRIEAMLRGRRR
jgi:hypothetical protein